MESVVGEVIDLDFTSNLGLIRIRPDRLLTASPVVPKTWEPRGHMTMLTAGCSAGNDATFWKTTIIGPGSIRNAGAEYYKAIECRVAPKQGRTGGGLFTTDGYLAGVCSYAEPRRDAGLYVAPQSIYAFLERHDLSSCYASRSKENLRGDPADLILESGEPDQNPAQASEIAELKLKLAELTSQNDRLQTEVLNLQRELTRLGARAQAVATPGAARQAKAPADPNATMPPPGARLQSAPARFGTRGQCQSQTPDQTSSGRPHNEPQGVSRI